jgi:hypothetical protein
MVANNLLGNNHIKNVRAFMNATVVHHNNRVREGPRTHLVKKTINEASKPNLVERTFNNIKCKDAIGCDCWKN